MGLYYLPIICISFNTIKINIVNSCNIAQISFWIYISKLPFLPHNWNWKGLNQKLEKFIKHLKIYNGVAILVLKIFLEEVISFLKYYNDQVRIIL